MVCANSIIPQRAKTPSNQILALRHTHATPARQTPCSTARLVPRSLLQPRGILLFEFSSQSRCLLCAGCNPSKQCGRISTCPCLQGKHLTCLRNQELRQPVTTDVPSTAIMAGSAQGTNDGRCIFFFLSSSAPQTASSPDLQTKHEGFPVVSVKKATRVTEKLRPSLPHLGKGVKIRQRPGCSQTSSSHLPFT